MTEEPPPQKVPLIFFRSGKGTEPVREVAEGTARSRTSRRRERPFEGAMALASRNASVPADGQWSLGNPHRFADEAHGARNVVPVPRALGGTARLHQEDAGNARRGFGVGSQAPEGVNEMSKKHMGSSIDDFLKAEGVFEEAQSQAVKEVVAWQLAQAMKEKRYRRTAWPRC